MQLQSNLSTGQDHGMTLGDGGRRILQRNTNNTMILQKEWELSLKISAELLKKPGEYEWHLAEVETILNKVIV